MPLSWVTLVSFAVVLLVARIMYDIRYFREKQEALENQWPWVPSEISSNSVAKGESFQTFQTIVW